MSEAQQHGFMSLCKADGNDDDLLSRRAANGFSVEIPDLEPGQDVPHPGHRTLGFVFERISKFNHSW